MKIVRPIRLTLKAEMDDGRILDVIIPFSVPEGIQFVGSLSRERTDSGDTTRSEDIRDA